MYKRLLLTLTALCLFSLAAPAQTQTALPAVEPEILGYSSQRLERLHSGIQQFIDNGSYAGAVTLVARYGNIADVRAYGYRDLENAVPQQPDDIFRIFSMTKVVTSVGILMLYEQGQLDLNDPVSKFIPEIDQMQVWAGGAGDAIQLVPQERPLTIRMLLCHTSGIPYDFSAGEALAPYYAGNPMLAAHDGDTFIRELVKCPLVFQPGTEMRYGMGVDVLGVVIERITGQSLGQYLREQIFDPLHMDDTGFSVPEEKRSRLSGLYTHNADGLRAMVPGRDPISAPEVDGSLICGFESGGAGLYSTIFDYAKFAQMLLYGGEYNGARLLSPKTVELMTANHLENLPRKTHMWSDYEGFGLGVEVQLTLATSGRIGSIGSYGWDGAASTYFRVDPQEQTVELIFLQHMPYDPYHIFERFHTLHYQAIVE
ncbi:MAG: beta-lactamase family protein [Opitutales bacterium]|nr:beta-lactamase family protein [Opitutales bacterium]